jgi:hypothetical protein
MNRCHDGYELVACRYVSIRHLLFSTFCTYVAKSKLPTFLCTYVSKHTSYIASKQNSWNCKKNNLRTKARPAKYSWTSVMFSPQDWSKMFPQDWMILYAHHSGIGLFVLRAEYSLHIRDVLTFYFSKLCKRRIFAKETSKILTLASSDKRSAVL